MQTETARRTAGKSPSKKAVTGRSCYASKYALSERLVCGECGTLYRRCVWTRPEGKRIVWRCTSRLDYGKKYCHNSPTIDEAPLQQAILTAIQSAMEDQGDMVRKITGALQTEAIPFPGRTMSLGEIDRRLHELEGQFEKLLETAADDPLSYGNQFKDLLDEQTSLKEIRAEILAENEKNAESDRNIQYAVQVLEASPLKITEWEESTIRQLITQVKVLSKDEIMVVLKGGIEVRQSITK